MIFGVFGKWQCRESPLKQGCYEPFTNHFSRFLKYGMGQKANKYKGFCDVQFPSETVKMAKNSASSGSVFFVRGACEC